MVHQSEWEFCRQFGPKDALIPLAKCYYSQLETEREAGVIVLEDLARKGDLVPMWKGLNLDKCLNFVDSLAALHLFAEISAGSSQFPSEGCGDFRKCCRTFSTGRMNTNRWQIWSIS